MKVSIAHLDPAVVLEALWLAAKWQKKPSIHEDPPSLEIFEGYLHLTIDDMFVRNLWGKSIQIDFSNNEINVTQYEIDNPGQHVQTIVHQLTLVT